MNSTNAFTATVSEAAFVAGVTDRDIHRVVDELILPSTLFETKNGRLFGSLACVFASFYIREQRLSKNARLQIICELTKRFESQQQNDENGFFSPPLDLDNWIVEMDLLSVNIARYVDEAKPRIAQIAKADDLVTTDNDVLGGEPVFTGTRVPVRTIAAWVENGESLESIQASFPTITADMVEAAPLWAKTHPARGRPKAFGELNPGWKKISKKRVKLENR